MNQDDLWKRYAALPLNARRRVVEFMASIAEGSDQRTVTGKKRRGTIADESFIGIWRGRRDVGNSRRWVKSVREREWKRRGG